MESSTEAASTEPPAPTFSQVVFIDIPHSYPPATPVTCCYTPTAAFQPSSNDWVGIFKVGWSTTKDYHTFVWVDTCQDVTGQQSVTRHAVFNDYYLPKDEIEFYQFCYVDSTGQVRGASTPFCFRKSVEKSMESNLNEDILVVTTQEQVEQSMREKAEMQKELDRLMEENESLRRVVKEEQQEIVGLKEQNREKEREHSEVVEQLDQLKQENENLKETLQRQLKETDHFKEMLTQMKKQMADRPECNAAEQEAPDLNAPSDQKESSQTRDRKKYEHALMKINQLKQERADLRARVDAQSEEVANLNAKIREEERELCNMKDSIQLLQFDFQSSEREKERLSAELQTLQSLAHNMDDIMRKNQELCSRLSHQENGHNDGLKERCQTLTDQLQDTQAKLAAAKEESKNAERQAKNLEKELLQVREKLESAISSYEQAQQKSGEQEVELREAREVIADKDSIIEEKEHTIVLVSREKEELIRQNLSLLSDIEELRSVSAEHHTAPSAESPYDPTSASTTTDGQDGHQPEGPEHSKNLYETMGGVTDPEEESLVCRHCHERFPLITQEELEQHEQSHRICPFCMMVCDGLDQSVFEDHVYSHEL